MPTVLVTVAMQALGVLAVLVGVALLLPLGAALVVDGALVVALAVVAEHIVTKRPSAPPVGRSGPRTPGAV